MKLNFKLLFNLSDEENNNLGSEFNIHKDGVFLCGSLDTLGSWDLSKAIEMTFMSKSVINESVISKMASTNGVNLDVVFDSYSPYSSISSGSSIEFNPDNNFTVMVSRANEVEFQTTVEIGERDLKRINELNGIQYKFFVAQKSSSPESKSRPLFVKFIEYNWRQLDIEKLSSLEQTIEIIDKWPGVDLENRPSRIDSGWLIDSREHEIQFHFYTLPLELWSLGTERGESNIGPDLALTIVPFKHTQKGLVELKDYMVSTNDYDENQTIHNRRTRFNALNEPNFYSSHRIRFRENPTDLLFKINLYELEEDGRMNENKLLATGFYKANKYLLENSLVDIEVSMMSANQIAGTLKTEVLLIAGPKDLENTFIKKNFNYHFKKSCVPIGHRGMGKTFDAGSLPGTSFVENTIDSFREAYNRGAQMVEFDVVLTKDKIPIVYHDFIFCIDQLSVEKQQASQDSALNASNANLLSLAVNQLTYEEIKQNRIYSQKILKKSANLPIELKDFFTSKLMFPTLKEMCTQLDPKLGFNVEIKYPIDLEDGSHEVEDRLIKWLNRNEYVDCILKELYECCKDDNRCVILSAFDPNLCSMLRMKQNKFPVLFLTNGVTNKWVPYKDVRCKKTRMSLNFAKTENLHGIVAHAEELTKNLHLINILFNHASKSANFLAYSWGDELNELDKRRLMTESGINGIIYDRINEPNSL